MKADLGATAFIPDEPDTWEGWEDSAVHPDKLGYYLRELHALYKRYEYSGALYGHFGQWAACTPASIFDLITAEGIRKFHSFLEEATDLKPFAAEVLSQGEHGDGQSKAEFLPKMYGPELIRAFEEFKSIWDPGYKMNPGKIVKTLSAVHENLRLGVTYNPPQTRDSFSISER